MKTYCLLLLLLVGVAGTAQQKNPAPSSIPVYKWAVNINPLAMLNVDQRLMAGVEYRFQPEWSVLADVAFIPNSVYLSDNRRVRGLELRPALRRYFSKTLDAYVQGQLHYRLVNYQKLDWLGKNCVNGIPAYQQRQEFTFRKQQLGAAVVVGGLVRLGGPMLLDISAGLGFVNRRQGVIGQEGSCYNMVDDVFSSDGRPNNLVPVLPISVKLVFVIE